MLPADYDFTIVRGSQGPGQGLTVYIADSSLAPISFDDARLSIFAVAQGQESLLMRLSTLTSSTFTVTDVGSAQLTWAPTTAETRQIAKGSKTRYELEIRANSTEVVYLQGGITGLGGLNDDG